LFSQLFLSGHSLGLGRFVLFRQCLRLGFRRFASRRGSLLVLLKRFSASVGVDRVAVLRVPIRIRKIVE
jgi:hypothetical protein